ncbi:MAG TPA: prepilin peptidase [Solirubrobacteraceae bacterium]|jgi:leader peptidase (prepilin peptidase)/N-methyltransferase|nr:prepilin peptidase [Solirubrobacteraceae bacterium]
MTKHAPTIAAGASGALVIPLAAAIRFGLSPLVLTRLAILGAALGQLALVDVRERRIPNRIVLPATAICAAISIADGRQASTGLLLSAGLVVLLLAVSLAKPAMLGMGDVKLALLLLAALGSLASAALLLTLELYALLAVILLLRRGRSVLGSTLPLAPILAAGCIIALLI